MKTTLKFNDVAGGRAARMEIHIKKLASGYCQVTFAGCILGKNRKGYLLAPPEATLREVVNLMRQKLPLLETPDRYFHRNLYAMQRPSPGSENFMLLNS